MVSGILTQSSSRKQFASRRKRSWKREGGSYLYYRSVVVIVQKFEKGKIAKLSLLSLITFNTELDL